MRIAGRTHDSIVDGPGLRYVVFAQGCPLACPGCHNPQSQDPYGGVSVPVSEMIADWRSNPLLTGVTLSGGEPSRQPVAAAALARAAHDDGLDVWCWSGYRVEALLRQASTDPDVASLLSLVDVLVDGPYVQNRRTLQLAWRGSDNQRLIDLPSTIRSGRVTLYQDESIRADPS
ncbi:Choline trimethylamine-lyase activating enzyme [Austwickia sp. TVS 96-490-7B]|uniref:anaerobic ribonucleoside-triphosphate reductase activating protein n=1 Tax=Austwickia sp. TVS 96-490-7B TaxID=2830843 RepID=UPI001C595CCE|nr:anaerobic ribonucleoside-triphosphate reductase activating protein [Austwickia sp. TVS 96-490-7B]MBW3085565.1 Choline trimethylamine-lyase activating enzyme [Austwickia sp. TVS 96-490-7B]